MKKILSILSLFVLSLTTVSAQNCDLPSSFEGNTGSNMTVMLLAPFINSLNVSSPDAYLVALNQDGTVIGSSVVSGVSQTTLAVWGDDSETTDVVDGALANEVVNFQLVDGTSLNDVTMPVQVIYTANGLSAQNAAAVLTDACASDDVLGCTDATANNFNVAATLDDESCTYDSSGDPITYSLSAGWNMVGYTGATEQNVTEFLTDNDLLSQFVIIKDISGKLWTPEVSLLQNFVPGEGYLMFSNSDVNISFSASFNPISYNLSAGWNMVGYTGDTEQNVTEFLTDNDLLSQFVIIKDISGKLWTPDVSLLQKFVPGEGYLMFSNSSKDLSFTD